MQITRQADYALRAIIHLARLAPNQKATTNLIAKEQNIPPSFLAKIISQLSIAGLIYTSRGAHGGVSLAKPPDKISVLDVVEAIDGPIALNECTTNPAACVFIDECPLRNMWITIREELLAKLGGTSFAHLADTPNEEKA
jgi:Rrf2 family protein